MTLDVYLDFVSPYAFLAWRRAPQVLGVPGGAHPLRPRVVLLGPILAHHGNLGPAEIAPKRGFTIRETMRRAAVAKVPFAWPEKHPFKSVLAAKAFHAAPEEERARLTDALFAAAWADGHDLEDREVIHAALAAAGLDASAILTRAASAETGRALREATAAAIERGIFGVPTFVDESGELFFGDDQLERLAQKRSGLDPLAREHAAQVEARPFGVRRKATQPAAPPGASTANAVVELAPDVAASVLCAYQAPFLGSLGVEVLRLAPGETVSALDVRPDHRQQDGFVHAGVLATLADHGAGACSLTTAPAGMATLTVEFKINLLRPALGPRVICRARTLRGGKTLSIVEAEVFDVRGPGPEETLVAKQTVTLALRPLR
jgi:uncharacterized protein (TIGR00369 family)